MPDGATKKKMVRRLKVKDPAWAGCAFPFKKTSGRPIDLQERR